MTALVLGLLLLLGPHSVRIFADTWRQDRIAAMGLASWKAVYAFVSLVGLALIVWGYGAARAAPLILWMPPLWTRHLAALVTLPVFILFVAAYLPGTRIRRAVGHPMVLGVKTWALAHLLSNGTLADVVLFGTFLVWSVAAYAAARRRDRLAGIVYPAGSPMRDVSAVVIGLAAWALFTFWLHRMLIGVAPLG